ncbi:Serine O-succinyltransferase [Xanthoria parietina]
MEPVAKAAITRARQAIRSLPLPTRSTPTISRGRSPHLSFSPRAQHSLHSRRFHQEVTAKAQAAVAEATQQSPEPPSGPTNPALAFPCLDAREAKTASLVNRSLSSGPEPSYNAGQHLTWNCQQPLLLDWGGLLPEYNVAYETWGQLDAQKSNAILLHTGLSASSHAHSTPANPKPGWWEKFIGPGAPLDTDKYFVICTNVIGSCYGSTGPQSIDPANGEHYATRFPILTMQDMVRAQFRLLDAFGIKRLYASLGSSMGGMQSLAAGVLFPERVGRIVSISGCARSHPYSIAMRHTQRQVLMMDPNWSRGFYYDGIPPHAGMKLAREIATVTYRSGPEWEQRFGRRRADPARPPALCPDFLIETYLDHAGEKFCLEYDANSLLYVSKAMDLFDLGRDHQEQMRQRRRQNESALAYKGAFPQQDQTCSLVLPETPYEEQPSQTSSKSLSDPVESTSHRPPADLVAGLSSLRGHPTLVMGVASDNLFPAWQQREVAETLRAAGNRSVTHVELGEDTSLFGHDTFLLDLKHIGGSIRTFLG